MKDILDVLPIFIFERDKIINLKDNITFMVSITEEDEENIEYALENSSHVVLERTGLDLIANKDRIRIYGETLTIPEDIGRSLNIDSMWYNVFENVKERKIKRNDKGTLLISQYFDPHSILKIAISMIGHPERIIVANMRYYDYTNSHFYNKIVKPITHGTY